MGYAIHQLPSRFVLSKNHSDEALAAVKSLAGQETCGTSGQMHFMWLTDSTSFISASRLDEVLRIWRWEADFDDDGSITDLTFTGENLGDEDRLFAKLAPFVEAGSYIAVVGEDGAIWRWVFENGRISCEEGTVTFHSGKGEPCR